MENNGLKKILVRVGGGIVVLMILVAVFTPHNPKPTQLAEGSNGLVSVDDHGKLQDMLFDLQYYAVLTALSEYISKDVSPTATSAEVIGEPTVPGNGLIRFTVETANPKKDFTVDLDRQTYFDKIILTIPATHYKKTLQIYEQAKPL